MREVPWPALAGWIRLARTAGMHGQGLSLLRRAVTLAASRATSIRYWRHEASSRRGHPARLSPHSRGSTSCRPVLLAAPDRQTLCPPDEPDRRGMSLGLLAASA